MTPFEQVFIPLSAGLGLSLVVERSLELIQNLFDNFILRPNVIQVPKAPKLSEIDKNIKKKNEYDKESANLELPEQYSQSIILLKPAGDPDDGKTLKKLILQLVGFAIGILLARFTNLHLFDSIFKSLINSMPVDSVNSNYLTIIPWLDNIFTGLLIGGGSAPLHSIIRFVLDRKEILESASLVTKPEPEKSIEPEPAKKEVSPALISTTLGIDWIDIPYTGGVDKEILENINFRKANPDTIVLHHTAMHSSTSFQDVVDVIKNRKTPKGTNWITAYNCVILADGSINSFCRWDRAGCHAGDYNNRSLGLAFNGNFETNMDVPFANINNKYGIDRPTSAQLKSGAIVITLWLFLYNMKPDFEQTIIPHKKCIKASTVCPGSNFPYNELANHVQLYYNSWKASPQCLAKIEEFKLKPYLYVKEVV